MHIAVECHKWESRCFCRFVGRTARSFNKLPHEMIQGTPKIMDSVTNNERDRVWNGLNFDYVERCVIDGGHGVRLGPKSVWLILDENLDSCIKVTDVLFGAFNFEANATDAVGSHANLSLALWPRFTAHKLPRGVTKSSTLHSRSVTPAAMAGLLRSVR
jgi:hypothetical protein